MVPALVKSWLDARGLEAFCQSKHQLVALLLAAPESQSFGLSLSEGDLPYPWACEISTDGSGCWEPWERFTVVLYFKAPSDPLSGKFTINPDRFKHLTAKELVNH